MERVERHRNWDLYACDDHYHIKLTPQDMGAKDVPENVIQYCSRSKWAKHKEGSLVLVEGLHGNDPDPFEIVTEFRGDYSCLRRLEGRKSSHCCPAWLEKYGLGRHERFFREDYKMYRRATFRNVPPNDDDWEVKGCGDHFHIALNKDVRSSSQVPSVVRRCGTVHQKDGLNEGAEIFLEGYHGLDTRAFVLVKMYKGAYWALKRAGDSDDSIYCTPWNEDHGKGPNGGKFHRGDMKLYPNQLRTKNSSASRVNTHLHGVAQPSNARNTDTSGVMEAGGYDSNLCGSTLQSQPAHQGSYGWFEPKSQQPCGNFDAKMPYPNDQYAFQPQPRMPETTFNNHYDPSLYPQRPEADRNAFYNYGNHASSFVLQQPVASSDPTYASEVPTSSSRQREERSGAPSNRDSAHKSSKKSASVSKSKKSRPYTSHKKAH